MALLTVFLKDGRDVLGEGHRRRRICGLLGRCLVGQRVKENYRYGANPGPHQMTTEASFRHMRYLGGTLHH
jgi:hypothetical protein